MQLTLGDAGLERTDLVLGKVETGALTKSPPSYNPNW